MKDLMAILAILMCARFFYVQGLKDADFDRKSANLRLQQCLEVIKK